LHGPQPIIGGRLAAISVRLVYAVSALCYGIPETLPPHKRKKGGFSVLTASPLTGLKLFGHGSTPQLRALAVLQVCMFISSVHAPLLVARMRCRVCTALAPQAS
jgi:hypothetical protein